MPIEYVDATANYINTSAPYDHSSFLGTPLNTEAQGEYAGGILLDTSCAGVKLLVGLTGDLAGLSAALATAINTFSWGSNMLGLVGIISFGLLVLVRLMFHNYGFSRKHEFSTIASTFLLFVSTAVIMVAHSGYSYKTIYDTELQDPALLTNFFGGVNVVGGMDVSNDNSINSILTTIISGYISVFCVLLHMILKTIFDVVYNTKIPRS